MCATNPSPGPRKRRDGFRAEGANVKDTEVCKACAVVQESKRHSVRGLAGPGGAAEQTGVQMQTGLHRASMLSFTGCVIWANGMSLSLPVLKMQMMGPGAQGCEREMRDACAEPWHMLAAAHLTFSYILSPSP